MIYYHYCSGKVTRYTVKVVERSAWFSLISTSSRVEPTLGT